MDRITHVRKTETGDICGVKLSDGAEMTLQEAVKATEGGKIEGVIVGTDRAGGAYLHSKRGQYDYKLADLPEL